MKPNPKFSDSILRSELTHTSKAASMVCHVLLSLAFLIQAQAADYRFYTDSGTQTNGLVGSYVNQSLPNLATTARLAYDLPNLWNAHRCRHQFWHIDVGQSRIRWIDGDV